MGSDVVQAAYDRAIQRAVKAPGPLRTRCLVYPSRNGRGYPQIRVKDETGAWVTLAVHRVVYRVRRGPIPAGYHVHHRCGETACVNVAHLAAIPPRRHVRLSDNAAGRNARKTECANGHPFTAETTLRAYRGGRRCRVCHAANSRRSYARKAAA